MEEPFGEGPAGDGFHGEVVYQREASRQLEVINEVLKREFRLRFVAPATNKELAVVDGDMEIKRMKLELQAADIRVDSETESEDLCAVVVEYHESDSDRWVVEERLDLCIVFSDWMVADNHNRSGVVFRGYFPDNKSAFVEYSVMKPEALRTTKPLLKLIVLRAYGTDLRDGGRFLKGVAPRKS